MNNILKNVNIVSKREFIFVTYSFFYLFSLYIILTVLASSFGSDYQAIALAVLNFEISMVMLATNLFVKKVNRAIFAYASPILVILLLIFPFVLKGFILLVIVFMLAPIVSIGLLIFFRYFKQTTASTGQARLAGMIAFLVLPLILVLGGINPRTTDYSYIFVFMLLSSLGMVFALRTKPKKIIRTIAENSFEKKAVFLYLVPWILFSIVNVTLAKNLSGYMIAQTSTSVHLALVVLQIIGVNLGVIIAGFLADFFGRKISLVLSLTLYGVSSVLCGLIATAELFTLVYFFNGMSWGILFVLYIFVVWGDLANKDNWAKIYSIGAGTYFASLGIGTIIPQATFPISTSSLLICLIMFLSILPIFLSPELTSIDYIEKIRLNKYVNKVKKLKTMDN
jgi:hypothetical protein